MIETATVEAPKKRGRPRKPSIEPLPEPESTESQAAEPLENDAESTIGDESRQGIPPYPQMPRFSSIERVLSVWNSLTERQREFGNIYLYREWPKMLLVLQKNRLVNENCDKFTVLDGPLSLDLIKQRRRMGKYYARIVQRVEKPYGQLSQSEPFAIEGNLENIEDMPILDLEKLDRAHPDNESYIRILKLRGIIQVDGDKNEGDGEMAAQEVLGDITKTLLNDRIQDRGQQQPQTAAADTASAAVGVRALEILERKMEREAPAGQQGTLVDTLNSLGVFIKNTTPAPADFAPFLASIEKTNQMVLDLKEQEVKRATVEAERARVEAQNIRAALPVAKTIDEQWDEMERSAKRFRRMTGADKEDEEEDEKPEKVTAAGFWGGLLGALPAIMKSGVELLREGNVMLYNYKLNGAGAVPLNPATGQPGTEPLAPAEQEDNEPALSPEDQARMDHMQNVANQLTALASPMLSHLSRNKTGADFARFVIENYGPPAFALLQNTGKETIFAMIQNYPPVWNQIGPQRLPQFQKFLDEFIGYKAVAVQ